MWDWLKQTGRNAIDSTTRMLRKLETPELEVEQPHEEELRIQPDSSTCSGGGYDPYNQPTKSRRTPTKYLPALRVQSSLARATTT